MSNTLIQLKDKFKSVVETTEGIKKFVFDDLSQINNDSTDEYPLFLLKPPSSRFIGTDFQYQIFDVEAFLFDIEYNSTPEHWTEIWDKMQGLMRTVLQTILEDRKNFVLTNEITFEVGHFQHNEKLVGVRATLQIRMYYGC